MSTSVRTISFLCLAFFAGRVEAQWSSDPLVNLDLATSSASQDQPKVRATASGGSYVSWYDSDPSGSPPFGFDVRIQELDSGGHELFPHGGVLVADRGFSSTQDYGLAVDTAGNGLLAFRDDRFTGTQVTAAKIDAATGALVWGAGGVQLTNTTAFIATPKITGTSDGNVLVGWSQDADLHLMKLDPNGVPLWSGDVVFTPSAGNNFGISDLQASDAGGAVVSFVEFGSFFSPKHLLAQKVDTNGNLLWGASHVSVFDGGSLQFGNFPTFVSDGNGGAVFGWYGTSPLECYAQHIASDGSEVFAHNGVTASTDASKIRVCPSVAYDAGAGDVLLFYEEENSVQSMYGVSAQRFDASGNRLFGSTGTSVVPLGSSAIIGVKGVALGGDSMLFWISEPSFGNDKILGATLDGAGAVSAGPFDVSTTIAGKSRLGVDLLTTGVAVATFADDRNGNNDIFVQDALANGSLGGLAGVVSRNGGGGNTVCFTNQSEPIVGASWDTLVTTSGHPGATMSLIVAFQGPSSGIILPAGELLVDLTSPLLAASAMATSGADLHSLAVPLNASIIGAVAYTQAVILGGGFELCNALDATVGL